MRHGFSGEFIPRPTFETQPWIAEQVRNHNLFGVAASNLHHADFQFPIIAQETRRLWASGRKAGSYPETGFVNFGRISSDKSA